MKTMETEGTDTLIERARKASGLCEPENYEEAVGLYRQALRENPSCADAYSGLAEAYALWGFRREVSELESRSYYDQAFSCAERGLELAPLTACVHRAMAVALRRGSRADAERRCSEAELAVEIAPECADSWYELWRASGYSLEDPAVKKALTLRPAFFAALHDLGVVLCEHERHAEALRFIDRALAVNAGSRLARYNHAMVLHFLGRVEESCAEMRALSKERPDDAMIAYGLTFLEEHLDGQTPA
ncbi:MAG TPA: hypothetical protein DCZ01_10530 [Elusimicrobia bacterium]|nr:MAG: hypothetical protein A2X37_03335 [Elusimicrobia bacterium GWA2_66_18]OGR74376.1 MAG: hypothetical protein A2X40_10220 [Elusimicrobia bacterium GWC2_65_9]HAZ08934.1 hypothetical protein [Elusimicrobiota bacterium]